MSSALLFCSAENKGIMQIRLVFCYKMLRALPLRGGELFGSRLQNAVEGVLTIIYLSRVQVFLQ